MYISSLLLYRLTVTQTISSGLTKWWSARMPSHIMPPGIPQHSVMFSFYISIQPLIRAGDCCWGLPLMYGQNNLNLSYYVIQWQGYWYDGYTSCCVTHVLDTWLKFFILIPNINVTPYIKCLKKHVKPQKGCIAMNISRISFGKRFGEIEFSMGK